MNRLQTKVSRKIRKMAKGYHCSAQTKLQLVENLREKYGEQYENVVNHGRNNDDTMEYPKYFKEET